MDRNWFDDGRRTPFGIEHVFFNGKLGVKDGRRTAALAGEVL